MKRLTFVGDRDITDVRAIVAACAARGYEISAIDAKLAWETYSESMCAGWMHIPDDPGEVFNCIEPYIADT